MLPVCVLGVPSRETVETLPSAQSGLMQGRPGCSGWKMIAGLFLSGSWWLMTCPVALSTRTTPRADLGQAEKWSRVEALEEMPWLELTGSVCLGSRH